MDLTRFSLADLEVFQQALSRYIQARKQAGMAQELAQLGQEIQRAETELQDLDEALASQAALIEHLSQAVLGGAGDPNGRPSEGAEAIPPLQVEGEGPGSVTESNRDPDEAPDELPQDRAALGELLGISRTTLFRWLKQFAAFLSPECVGQGNCSQADVTVLLQVKALREEGADYQTIKAKLTQDDHDHGGPGPGNRAA
jgi:hypothetical protein